MSPIEGQESIFSEVESEQDEGQGLKLVPVSESIRYRKRAQSAEKKAEALAEELAQAKAEASRLAEHLSGIEVEQKLVKKLAAEGAVDIETAVLIAKARIEAEDASEVDGVIEQLKKEKGYLFGSQDGSAATAKKTAGVRDRVGSKQAVLERAAKRAAASGGRVDLQEYLRLRRNFA
jgi:hypothetical protein